MTQTQLHSRDRTALSNSPFPMSDQNRQPPPQTSSETFAHPTAAALLEVPNEATSTRPTHVRPTAAMPAAARWPWPTQLQQQVPWDATVPTFASVDDREARPRTGVMAVGEVESSRQETKASKTRSSHVVLTSAQVFPLRQSTRIPDLAELCYKREWNEVLYRLQKKDYEIRSVEWPYNVRFLICMIQKRSTQKHILFKSNPT